MFLKASESTILVGQDPDLPGGKRAPAPGPDTRKSGQTTHPAHDSSYAVKPRNHPSAQLAFEMIPELSLDSDAEFGGRPNASNVKSKAGNTSNSKPGAEDLAFNMPGEASRGSVTAQGMSVEEVEYAISKFKGLGPNKLQESGSDQRSIRRIWHMDHSEYHSRIFMRGCQLVVD